MRHARPRGGEILVGLTILGLFLAVPAQAVTFTVNSTTDAVDASPGDGVCETAPGNGECTLRAAIEETNALTGADTVSLTAGTYVLAIVDVDEDFSATGDLDIRDDLTINGAGAADTIVDGAGIDRVITTGGIFNNVEITGVTITNGDTTSSAFDQGGGIVCRGSLTLSDVVISQNTSSTGGGIVNYCSSLTISDSVISNNTATSSGGGLAILISNATTTLTRVTVSGNSSPPFGVSGIRGGGLLTISESLVTSNSAGVSISISGPGATIINTTISSNTGSGVRTGGGTPTSTATIINSTITGNSGVGISNLGSITLQNTIVSNNALGDCSRPSISNGNNIFGDTSCNSFADPSDLVNTDPLLGPLADNGDPTQTHALLPGSPAIDAGDNIGCPATDQRGVPRPHDGDGDGVATCDIGAYEARTLELSLATNGATFTTGNFLTTSVGAINLGTAATMDFYFGALLPDGETIVFFTDLAFNTGVGSLASPVTLQPIVAGVDLTTPFTFNQPAFFTFTWAGTEPPGSYVLFLAAVASGALADNSIDPGDVVAVSTATLTFTP